MKKILLSTGSVFILLFPYGTVAWAQSLSPDDANSIYNDTVWYKPGGGTCSTSGGSTGVTNSSGGFTLDQVKTFASEPIASTWNISDSTVEQWFLKQANAQPVIARYGLNSNNIGQITSSVQAAGVSPVFFYLYTVNEGGADGINDGFINHTDRRGLDGVAAATADAQYLASQSQVTSGKPATKSEPSDMPTAEAQQILSALPAGSLGNVYIQATAAATAELESLSGNTGDWTTAFGPVFSPAMHNIETMGGDPLQGGATISTVGCASSSGGDCGGSGKYSALVGSGSSFAGVDQGIDFVPSGSSGFDICAPASGTIVQADATGHHFNRTTGQAEVVLKLDQPPNAPNSGPDIYFIEIIQIDSGIHVGIHIDKGTKIGHNDQSPGIEVGWANGSGGPGSGLQPSCAIGYPTACGTSFDSWVQGISAGKGP